VFYNFNNNKANLAIQFFYQYNLYNGDLMPLKSMEWEASGIVAIFN